MEDKSSINSKTSEDNESNDKLGDSLSIPGKNKKDHKRPESFCVTSNYELSKKDAPKTPSRNSLSTLSPPNFEKKQRNSLRVAFANIKNSFSGIYNT